MNNEFLVHFQMYNISLLSVFFKETTRGLMFAA